MTLSTIKLTHILNYYCVLIEHINEENLYYYYIPSNQSIILFLYYLTLCRPSPSLSNASHHLYFLSTHF